VATIAVEVVYASPGEQLLLNVALPAGATVHNAIEASGVLRRYPEIDLAAAKVGIFSRPCRLDEAVADGDRVEIYRPLLNDPKQARRDRARRRRQPG
jgi:uncharacterized protein